MIEPYEHQFEGFDFSMKHHYNVNAFDMGLGKSLIGVMLQDSTQLRTLVISPAYLKANWGREFSKWTQLPPSVEILSNKELKNKKYDKKADVFIINFEMVKNCEFLFKWAELIIVDEAHYLKNPKAARTKVFVKFLEKHKPERLQLFSGTPVENNIGEWFAPIYFCSINPKKTSGTDIRELYKDQWAWQIHFSNMVKIQMGMNSFTKFEGHRNVPELKKILKNKFLRKLSKDCLDLPEYSSNKVFVDYDHDDSDMYDMWITYQSGAKKEVDESISTTKSAAALAKAPFTSKFVKDLLANEVGPVIVYSDHILPCKKIHEDLEKAGFKVGLIYGAISYAKRDEIAQGIESGKYDVVVAVIKSFCTGITMVKPWNMVFNDLNWVGTVNAQARKRMHRIGQTNKCVYHYILGSDIDDTIVNGLNRKAKLLKEIVDFKEDE